MKKVKFKFQKLSKKYYQLLIHQLLITHITIIQKTKDDMILMDMKINLFSFYNILNNSKDALKEHINENAEK